jgi:hypothetical protein
MENTIAAQKSLASLAETLKKRKCFAEYSSYESIVGQDRIPDHETVHCYPEGEQAMGAQIAVRRYRVSVYGELTPPVWAALTYIMAWRKRNNYGGPIDARTFHAQNPG